MQILKANFNPQPGAVMVLGNFDGVHLGHQALFKFAKTTWPKKPLLALSFSPHPKVFLNKLPAQELITPGALKVLKLKALQFAPDAFCALDFAGVVSMPAKDFAKLLTKKGAQHVVVGANFRFGPKAANGIKELTAWGKEMGFKLHVPDVKEHAGRAISSTRIRECLKTAQLQEANQMLGSGFRVLGNRIKGKGRGQELGFGTWNIACTKLMLPYGVYAGFKYPGKAHGFVCNYGTRPSFGPGPAVLEVHFLSAPPQTPAQKPAGEPSKLAEKTIQVELLHFIRAEKTFPHVNSLVKQISQDVKDAKRLLHA